MLYELAWILCSTILRAFYGFRSFGRRNVPQTGGVILAINHASFFDQYDPIKYTYDRLKQVAPGIKACSTVVHPVEPIAEVIDAWWGAQPAW